MIGRVLGLVFRRLPDLVHEAVDLGCRVEPDLVLLEDSLHTGLNLGVIGSEVSHDDELKRAELGCRMLVQRLALHGVAGHAAILACSGFVA